MADKKLKIIVTWEYESVSPETAKARKRALFSEEYWQRLYQVQTKYLAEKLNGQVYSAGNDQIYSVHADKTAWQPFPFNPWVAEIESWNDIMAVPIFKATKAKPQKQPDEDFWRLRIRMLIPETQEEKREPSPADSDHNYLFAKGFKL